MEDKQQPSNEEKSSVVEPTDVQNTTEKPSEPAVEKPMEQEPIEPSPDTQASTSTPAPVQPVSNEPKKSGKKILLIILGVVVVVIILITIGVFALIGGVNNATSEPLKASDTFLKTIQSGNADSAYSLTTRDFQTTNTKTAFEDFVKQYDSQIRGDYTTIISKNVATEYGKQTATFVYNAQTKQDSSNVYIRVVVYQENGTWKVHEIRYQQQAFE